MESLQDFAEYIPFSSLNAESLEPALQQTLENAKLCLVQLENIDDVSWNSLQNQLYLPLYKLNRLWGLANHLLSVNDNQQLRDLQEKFQSKISEFYVGLGQNKQLFKCLKSLAQKSTLSNEESKIINNEFRDFKLSGIELAVEEQLKFKDIQNQLTKLSTKFEQNILDATDSYAKLVTREELTGVPDDIIAQYKQAAIDSGETKLYKITLHIPSYLPIMEYCANRKLREELYHRYVTRASELGESKLDNSQLICRILNLRHKKAKLLGFNNFTDLSLFTKMAQSSDQVLDFLYQLADKSKNHAQNDLAELKAFAASECALDKLEAWDIPYVGEKLQQYKYNYSNWELKQYFPLPRVLDGLFKLIFKLYQVEFKLNQAIPRWHPDIQAFDIIKNSENIGIIYMDLFARLGKQSGAWMNSMQDRYITDSINKKPYAAIVCNFTPPASAEESSLLTFDEVQTLFHEMGHALHHLLTTVNHYAISGINGVEWDAVELPSQFMEYFVWNKKILDSISSHIKTGKPIPDELYQKILRARHYQSGLIMVRQLEFAILDLMLHQTDIKSPDDYLELTKHIRKQVAVITPPEYNRFLNSFSHIFAGGYASGYYSYKWAEVLATDIFNLFDDIDDYTELGKKFHSTILSRGGLNTMLENFIAFMGREPQIAALLKYSGIN